MLAIRRTLILRRMPVDLANLLEQIDAVLAQTSPSANADVTRIENTLTDGYARALQLEAERWRLERKIAEVARLIGSGDTTRRAAELSRLSQRLVSTDGDLGVLRSRLAELRQHAEAVRAA
jgi:hypothetical protein